jgi:hypothetical protein
MNIYYTAKDIEELVTKGIYELELGPNTSLTDFARETAEQMDVTLIDGAQQAEEMVGTPLSPSPSVRPQAVSISQSYNKPRGCQAGAPSTVSRTADVPVNTTDQSDSAPVNRLVDLMGKIIKRGE